VQEWIDAAGHHCEQIHQHLILKPRDLEHVQADELRVKTQGSIVWMAMAVMVSTRLWLGGAISPRRDTALIRRLVALLIRACASPERPLLVAADGLITYVKAFAKAFRSKHYTGRVGAPRLIAWPKVVIGQVIKRYERRRVVGVERRLVQGSWSLLERLLDHTQGGRGVLNTAYIASD
jgi:transposase-like protein